MEINDYFTSVGLKPHKRLKPMNYDSNKKILSCCGFSFGTTAYIRLVVYEFYYDKTIVVNFSTTAFMCYDENKKNKMFRILEYIKPEEYSIPGGEHIFDIGKDINPETLEVNSNKADKELRDGIKKFTDRFKELIVKNDNENTKIEQERSIFENKTKIVTDVIVSKIYEMVEVYNWEISNSVTYMYSSNQISLNTIICHKHFNIIYNYVEGDINPTCYLDFESTGLYYDRVEFKFDKLLTKMEEIVKFIIETELRIDQIMRTK